MVCHPRPSPAPLTVGGLRQSTITFLRRIGFEVGQRIWLKLSWDLPLVLAPDWECYTRKGQRIPKHKVFQGTITKTGFKLRRCKSDGKRRGRTYWRPDGPVYRDGWKLVYRWSQKGVTVSFYPNQPQAGISNIDVKRCRCLFYEIDDASFDEQKARLRRLCRQLKVKPAGALFSGNKSLHVYFRLSHDLEPEDWIRLNRKLCILQNADPQICNLARAMRLPGMLRRGVVEGELARPTIVKVMSTFDKQLSAATFEAKLDRTGLFPHGLDDARWRQWFKLRLKASSGEDVDPTTALLEDKRQTKKSAAGTAYRPRPASRFTRSYSRDSGSIPLMECLTKDDADLIRQGVPEGFRHRSGYKLACNLVGTAGFLESERVSYYPAPEALFREYRTRCSPPMDEAEADLIWHNANREYRQPSRSEDSIRKTVDYYYGMAHSNPYAQAATDSFSPPEPNPELKTLIQYVRKKVKQSDGTL
ncbi:hypothetical protein [Phormidium sp. FACHB-1136]|uniref:hypothetical protein n=1 Tax=Phormidium sp. FACHB-1136 TaxID=2692848 RepID=UPI001688E264|nr:hypothetical protein [Phormidium sp. FACHB-1136]MBD2428303.1 hypothetical protein [Phormidium sp. FACHB-1136]